VNGFKWGHVTYLCYDTQGVAHFLPEPTDQSRAGIPVRGPEPGALWFISEILVHPIAG
jgi:exoribonuclease II